MASRVEISKAIQRVLDSGHYVLGPEVEAFESEFAEFVGAPFAVGVNSGTDGLALALRGLGIGPGDEVVTVSHTAVATVAAIEIAGATPVLVDVESDFLTMDPAQAELAINSRTRAIVPVHLYGQVADLASIGAICRKYGLALIEDASQSHGARWQEQHVGLQGDAAVFSCYPTKNLGALGDAGVISTGDADLAKRLKALRQYGWEERNCSVARGVNSRLDELQAAILRVKLQQLPRDLILRRSIADKYACGLSNTDLILPLERPGSLHAYHLYVVRHPRRDMLRQMLRESQIETAIHYPLTVHQQPAYVGRVKTVGSLSVSESTTHVAMSLPMFPELTDVQTSRVIRELLVGCSVRTS